MSSRIKYYVRYGVSWSQVVSVIISKSNRVGTMEHINVSWMMLLTKETKTTLLGSTITFTMDQRQVSLTNFFQPRFENNEVSSSMHVFTYQSCWFRVWRKTISWYVSLDVMSNDILLDVLANFCCFPFFCFFCCCCFFFALIFYFCFVVCFFLSCQSNCIANPCKNNATCQSGFTDKGYRCLCSAGFKGQICDEGNAIF